MALLFPFREIYTHNQLQVIPPFIPREVILHTFANPLVKRLVPKSPRPENSQRWPFLFPFRIFLIAISMVAVSSNLFPRFPKPNFLNFRCAHKVFLSTLLYSIRTSYFTISWILMQRFQDFTPRNPETFNLNWLLVESVPPIHSLTPLWPTQSS